MALAIADYYGIVGCLRYSPESRFAGYQVVLRPLPADYGYGEDYGSGSCHYGQDEEEPYIIG